jgi:hypothetical protein
MSQRHSVEIVEEFRAAVWKGRNPQPNVHPNPK